MLFVFEMCFPTEMWFKLQNQKQSLINSFGACFQLTRRNGHGLRSPVTDLIPNTTRVPYIFHKAVNMMLLISLRGRHTFIMKKINIFEYTQGSLPPSHTFPADCT